jgi:glycosyltransferase involved in cell wall biosynthesis
MWQGHRPAYYRAFCQILLELGHDVFAVCPSPDEIIPASATAGRLEVAKFDPPRRDIRPRRLQRAADALLENRWLRATLRGWEATHGRKISLVFFACINDEAFRFFPRTARGFPWPWSGLYVQCLSFRMPGSPIQYMDLVPHPERIFRHPNLQSLAILDEAAAEYMSWVARGRPITVFPDFTDETAPTPGGVGEELRQFAAGRPVVGLPGYLQPSKGVATLARVALDPANSDIVFAFIGQIMEYAFAPEERDLLERLKTAPNVYVRFARLPDEGSFNGVIKACDILFAAYHDFPHSSNMLIKGAVFKKPLIVSDGYLIAERVRRYRLGEVIPQKDPAAAAAAVRRVLTEKAAWVERHRPRWEAYCAKHSNEAAKRAVEKLLAGV